MMMMTMVNVVLGKADHLIGNRRSQLDDNNNNNHTVVISRKKGKRRNDIFTYLICLMTTASNSMTKNGNRPRTQIA